MERFVPVEGFDTNGSRNRGIPREETAGGLAPALRGEKWGRKRKGLGREPRRAALVTSMIGEYRVISKRNKVVFGFGAISVVAVSFQILGMEWFHFVFGSKNGVVLFFVWFESLDRTESFYFLFG
jgi:hypothetical protein